MPFNVDIVKQNLTAPPCPKCGDRGTRVIGQSLQPVMTYVRCDKCGHVFVPEKDDTRPMSQRSQPRR